ncbi:MAG TPA: HEAT repeat domain-containing protein [Dehalococcoidia bacterium]|nr:HEAT repeat domain-containing protein [Dehalococcoidia bacterium]
MGKIDDYREKIRSLPLSDWDAYLRANSNLPGPRGNLELAAAVAEEAPAEWLVAHGYCDAEDAAEGTPECFVACCAIQGLGRLAGQGDIRAVAIIKRQASDARWRIRESVAMALQRIGDANMGCLFDVASDLAAGGPLEQRAAAAGLAEPRLLKDPADAPRVIAVLDSITRSIAENPERKTDAFHALRQGMGYCWSVVIAAYPDAARPTFERWLVSNDTDVRWMLKENLKKKRLERLDSAWVASCLSKLE